MEDMTTWDELFAESPNLVTIDHATQTFEIGDIKLDRHQVLTLSVALATYYYEHDFIDSKGEVMDVRQHLKSLSSMRKLVI